MRPARGRETAMPRALAAEVSSPARDVVGAVLRSCGFDVDAVGDGCAASDAAFGYRYDMVLPDLAMPDVGGIEAVRPTRSRRSASSGAAIAAPTAAREEAPRPTRKSGMDGHVGKPSEASDLPSAADRRASGFSPGRVFDGRCGACGPVMPRDRCSSNVVRDRATRSLTPPRNAYRPRSGGRAKRDGSLSK